jgi:hypothetical protein
MSLAPFVGDQAKPGNGTDHCERESGLIVRRSGGVADKNADLAAIGDWAKRTIRPVATVPKKQKHLLRLCPE